jgi:hypothetical protein
MQNIDIKIRYNTNCNDNTMYWRVIIDGVEHLASDVMINIPTQTTRDNVFDPQRNEVVNKHHISCKANSVIFKEGIVEIW